MSFVPQATEVRTQSLALSCLASAVNALGAALQPLFVPLFLSFSHSQTPLLGIAQSVLLRPLRPEDVESHSYAYQLLTELLDAFGIAQLRSALPGILEAAFAAVQTQADFALSSTIFPFLSALAKQATPGDALGVSLARFLPYLDELVFGYLEYVDVKLPSAEEEFGSLGGAFEGKPKEEGYRIVRIDAERARCKVAALETMLRIYQERQRAGETLPAEELDNVASAIVSMCGHSNAEIQYSAVGTARRFSVDQGHRHHGADLPRLRPRRLLRHAPRGNRTRRAARRGFPWRFPRGFPRRGGRRGLSAVGDVEPCDSVRRDDGALLPGARGSRNGGGERDRDAELAGLIDPSARTALPPSRHAHALLPRPRHSRLQRCHGSTFPR